MPVSALVVAAGVDAGADTDTQGSSKVRDACTSLAGGGVEKRGGVGMPNKGVGAE